MNKYTRYAINNNRNHSSNRRSRKKKKEPILPIVLGLIVVLALIIGIVLLLKKNGDNKHVEAETTTETETFDDSRVTGDISIDFSRMPGLSGKGAISIKGLNTAEILEKVESLYQWDMVLVNKNADIGNVVKPTVSDDYTIEAETSDTVSQETYAEGETEIPLEEIVVKDRIELPDYIRIQTLGILEKVFSDNSVITDSKTYFVTMDDLPSYISEAVQSASDMWYKEAKGGNIGSYDAEKDEFLFEDAEDGMKVDTVGLSAKLNKAFANGQYDAEIPVDVEVIPAGEASKKNEYRIIAEYVTNTTNNAVRNRNVELACNALNGTIIRSGEEFSFNDTIGQRTKEKGYGEAAAYFNGEVINEVGGGVCQVSSTLYNAVLIAGLKTTMRRSHTFKPTYVTPGQDATVSWQKPDYRFANVPYNSEAEYSLDTTSAIGIRAKYEDRTVTVSIYGKPVLKDGYELSLESEQIATYDVVRVPIPPEDLEKQPTTGDQGSAWKTYLVVKKNGETISRTLEHSAVYSGHTEWYREEESSSESESVSEESIEGPVSAGPASAVTLPVSSAADSPAESNIPDSPIQKESEAARPDSPVEDPGNSEGPVEPGGDSGNMYVEIPGEIGNGPGE